MQKKEKKMMKEKEMENCAFCNSEINHYHS